MQITRTQKSLLKFQNKKLYEYHDFYVQNEKLLLTNVLENFLNICLKIHELDPAYFLSVTGLAWQAASKKYQSKVRSIT